MDSPTVRAVNQMLELVPRTESCKTDRGTWSVPLLTALPGLSHGEQVIVDTAIAIWRGDTSHPVVIAMNRLDNSTYCRFIDALLTARELVDE